ncbi:methyl-accepting chemotaxis protein [Aciduricibacillus chroicocephali]|uniref:Methyl-accepting chemotaxis protein n=1 Tax=Aciduricibacillus chroicocephali TaxID=3054939 RepID=A0ABY9KY01_9BACI|nr:methyl-accepting chemotaxis protein [Bacillaceae bacterium 44XB]
MKRQSISRKVSFILCISIAVVLAITGILINLYTKNMIKQQIESEMGAQSRAVAAKIDQFFAQKGQVVNQLTSDQSVLRYLDSTKGRKDALQNRNYKDMNKALETVKEMNPEVAMVWVASEKGNFLTGTGNVLSDSDFELKERPWYESVHNAKGLYYTEPYMDQVFGKVIMSVMKVVEVDGKEVGIVAADLFLDSLPSIMEQYKIGNSGYGILTAPDGNVIYHPDNKHVLKPLADAGSDWRKLSEKMKSGADGLMEISGKNKDYYVGYEPVKSAGWSVATVLDQNEVYAPLHSMTVKVAVIFIIALILLVLLTYFLLRHMLKNIPVMSDVINKIAEGDLTQRITIDSNDELGKVAEDMNEMLDQVSEFIGVVQENAQQVAATSEQLNVSTDQTAQAAQVVAETVDSVNTGIMQQINRTSEASGTISKMSTTFEMISDESDAVARQSAIAVEKAKSGEESVESAQEQMETINEKVHATAQIISRLGERSSAIGQIVDTISEISGQTNLLALNASIEASRAGESGKSFTVVANEVKKLAEQSNAAAGEIAELIREVQVDTEEAVASIREGTTEVQKGSAAVGTAGEAFHAISDIVSRVSGQMNEFSSSIQDLSSGVKHIVDIIDDVDYLAQEARRDFENVAAATEEQTATLEEIASASHSSSERALELQDAISKFKV